MKFFGKHEQAFLYGTLLKLCIATYIVCVWNNLMHGWSLARILRTVDRIMIMISGDNDRICSRRQSDLNIVVRNCSFWWISNSFSISNVTRRNRVGKIQIWHMKIFGICRQLIINMKFSDNKYINKIVRLQNIENGNLSICFYEFNFIYSLQKQQHWTKSDNFSDHITSYSIRMQY